MKKTISILFLLSTYLTYAQTGKTTIGLTPFRSNGYSQYESGVYEAVSGGFVESGRFIIVDRSVWGNIQQERDLQKGEEFLDSKIAEQGKSLGAESIVIGSINEIKTTSGVSNYGTKVYGASISISLKVVNVSTGESSASTSIFGSSGFFMAATSPVQAIVWAQNSLKKKTAEWIGKTFPVKAKIAKVLEQSDKKGITKILIAGGSGAGIKEGRDIKVVYYEDVEVDGKKIARTVEFAMLKVTKVEDENFSECSVKGMPKSKTEAGLEMKRLMDEGKDLYLITAE